MIIHDELLAKIRSFTCCSGVAEIALLAIMELHKPQEITLPDGEWGTNCHLCDGLYYPCLTIQVIEKQLNNAYL